MHPRNRHQGHYDFEQLIKSCPELAPLVKPSPYNNKLSIDFADPKAVMTLNQALLKHLYGVSQWQVPADYLCPPVPGRADYVHYAADLLAAGNGGAIPRGPSIRVLDIGVGANCIYPIIGHCEYGWHFVGTDTDPVALASAKRIAESNPALSAGIELRLQPSPSEVLRGILIAKERFDLSICNPPFHASLAEAQEGSRRKWRNLGRAPAKAEPAPVLNFGGQASELWYPGGEAAFVHRLIEESAEFAESVLWFSTLISKESNLPAISGALKRAKAADIKKIEMAQGQKKSRVIAWTFLNRKRQEEWRSNHLRRLT